MEYVCRRLSTRDADLVMGMNENFRPGFVERDAVLRFLNGPDNWLFAAVMEKTVIGFAYGYALSRLDGGGKMLYLHEVGVMEACQRRGVGTRLLRELKQACKRENIARYFLFTCQNNGGANALYRKVGGELGRDSQGRDVVYFFQVD